MVMYVRWYVQVIFVWNGMILVVLVIYCNFVESQFQKFKYFLYYLLNIGNKLVNLNIYNCSVI